MIQVCLFCRMEVTSHPSPRYPPNLQALILVVWRIYLVLKAQLLNVYWALLPFLRLCPALSISSRLEERCLSEMRGVRYGLGDLNRAWSLTAANTSARCSGGKGASPPMGSPTSPTLGAAGLDWQRENPASWPPACPLSLLWILAVLCLWNTIKSLERVTFISSFYWWGNILRHNKL